MTRLGLKAVLWLGWIVALVGTASAASGPTVNPAIVAAETRVSLGLTATGFNYRETFDNASDEEHGVLAGFGVGASRLGELFGVSNVYTGILYDFSGGSVNYKGYLQNSGRGLVPYDQAETTRINRFEVRLGRAVPLMNSLAILPFVTAGYQTWARNVGGSGDYGTFYRAVLAGFGAKLDYAATNRLMLSATGEGYALVGGHVSSPYLGFSASMAASGEEAVRLGADWRLDNAWHIFAGLDLRHFNYAGSKLNNGFYEPTSSTFEARGEMGVAFGFR